MLKKLLLNNKTIPVPVPVRTLGEAVHWIETTLVPEGHTLTRIVLDGRVVSSGLSNQTASGPCIPDNLLKTGLGESSKLEILVDSPSDLAIQALDAVHNLASVILSGLKPAAVTLWQARPNERQTEVETVAADLRLVLDLLGHLAGLVDSAHADAAPLQGIATLMSRVETSLQMAKANSDWKGCARILLNRVEPLLKDLVVEADSMQVRVLATRGGTHPAWAADAGRG